MEIPELHTTEKQAFWQQTIRYIVGRKKVEECLGFLVESGKILSGHTSFYKTLPGLAEIAVPFLGDWFSIDLLFGSGRVLNIAEKYNPGINANFHKKIGRAFRPQLQKNPEGAYTVIIATKSILYKTSSLHPSDLPKSILSELGVRSAMIIPLRLPAGYIGAMEILSFDEYNEKRSYGPADLALAEELGRRISLAVERSVLYYTNRSAPATAGPGISTYYLKENPKYNHNFKI